MTRPCIGITGAKGFIGSALVRYFRKSSYPVILLSSHADTSYSNERYFSLSEAPVVNLLRGIDILVHAAHDSNSKTGDTNFPGSKDLFDLSKRSGIRKVIFLSSRAASANSPSPYGQIKLAIENELSLEKDVILRCGLVIGAGGLFKKLVDSVAKEKTIPLINNGKQPMQFLTMEELAEGIEKCIQYDLCGTFNMASNETMTYKEFFDLLCRLQNKKPRFIRVPEWALDLFLSVCESLKIPLPVNRSSLAGLTSMKYVSTAGDLKRIGLHIREPGESIKQYFTD